MHRRSLNRNNCLFKRGETVENEPAAAVDGDEKDKKRKKILPKVQRTQYIQYFNSFNTFISKQKLQQALKSWSNFSLVLFGKGQEIHRTTLTNPCSNFDNPCDNLEKSMY